MFGFLLSAYKSGSGKTVLSSAIVRSYSEKGYYVSPYKCGPDYVDTLWLSKAAKLGESTFYKEGVLRARNLDTVLMSRSEVKSEFHKGLKRVNDLASTDACSKGCCAVVEGVMGLFDGLDPITFKGSSYEIAKMIDIPIVVIIDAKGVAASVASLLAGIVGLAKGVNIAGVILNRVSSKRQEEILRAAINCHVPQCKIVGCVPHLDELSIPARHLGLDATAEEQENSIANAARAIESYINFDELASITKLSSAVVGKVNRVDITLRKSTDKHAKIAYVAYDEAFNFYYQSTLDLLQSMGYDVKLFSPLANEPAHDADLIFIGGGYPELYAGTLSQNKESIESIREHHRMGKPIYSEGGGFVYLAKELRIKQTANHLCAHSNHLGASGAYSIDSDADHSFECGDQFNMVGIFDIVCEMTAKRQRLGYYSAELMPLRKSQEHSTKLANADTIGNRERDKNCSSDIIDTGTGIDTGIGTGIGTGTDKAKFRIDATNEGTVSDAAFHNVVDCGNAFVGDVIVKDTVAKDVIATELPHHFLALAHAFHYIRVLEGENGDSSIIKLTKMSNKEVSKDGFKIGSAYGGQAHYMPTTDRFFIKTLE